MSQTATGGRLSIDSAASRLSAGVLLAVLLVLVAAACGDDGGEGRAADDGGALAPDLPSVEPEEPVTTTTVFEPRGFTVAASGDILVHSPVMASAQANSATGGYEFGPMFDEVRDTISAADLAICHQETPISPDNSDLSGYPVFNAPNEVAPALAAAGFDACEATSNHSLDRGFPGVVATLDALDANGIQHTGTARSAEESTNPPIRDVNGVAVGHLAYTYGYNGIPVPAEAPWLADVVWPEIGVERLLADAATLRGRGAEFVVVSMQWGNEYQQEPTAEQRVWAQTLLASPDVDLILGDHVHVVQPCEKIGGKYVHYGMGNFLSNQSAAAGLLASTQDGVVVSFAVEETAPGEFTTTSMTYSPTFVAIPGHRIELATPDRHPESHARTTAAMTALGPGACDATPAY